MSADGHLSQCPTDDVIRGFAFGEISDSWAEMIAQHVSDCSECATKVHEMFASNGSWKSARDKSTRQSELLDTDPLLEEILQKAKTIPQEPSAQPRPKRRRRVPRKLGRYKVIKPIGVGAFGRVYLADDPELRRQVAIKLPRRRRRSRDQLGQIIQEARSAAKLRHPGIISVFDMGRTHDNRIFGVFEFVSGETLDSHFRKPGFSIERAVAVTIEVAEALHYAHTNGIVHRDLKPSNILIDEHGRARIADFGLALHNNDPVRRQFAGTPSYMSPEQLRGETHHLNGATDIWSLGVILYRMLTRHRPFRAASTEELYEQILHGTPRSPRELDGRISAELQRICLRCLEKNRICRYASARELIEDLKAFQEQATSIRQLDMLSIRSKGLRPWDAQDAKVFLRLLPGSYDRSGVPDSLRFWKQCFDLDSSEGPLPVSVLFGPIGSGKTSFVHAGLIPSLPTQITPIVVECAQRQTEMELSRLLREKYEQLSPVGLVEKLLLLRTEILPQRGERLLIVFDQFEQWLHGRLRRTPLVDALRQFDGEHIMGLLVVRSEFWDTAGAFCRELELRLAEHHNYATLTMFPPKHAKSVLTAFGRGCGMLPPAPENLSSAQHKFLDLATEALSQNGAVAPIRLSLFADIMSDRPWLPKTIRNLRGPAGVDFEFLNYAMVELSEHTRYGDHRRAAQDVLWSLLPDDHETLKTAGRSVSQLMQIAAYRDRTGYFDELISILDTKLRLVTPVDPEGPNGYKPLVAANEEESPGFTAPPPDHDIHSVVDTPYDFKLPEVSQYSASERCYRLTNDYLVPALREFLTREQRSTLEGRVRLRLRELGRDWSMSSDARHVPGSLECLAMTFVTDRSNWTSVEREIMRMAWIRLLKRGGTIAAIIMLMLVPTLIGKQRANSRHFVQQLLVAEMKQVPRVVDQFHSQPPRVAAWLDAEWQRLQHVADTASAVDAQDGMVRLAMASVDYAPERAKYIVDSIFRLPPEELPILAGTLQRNPADSVSHLWDRLQQAAVDANGKDGESTLRLASALATADPHHARWTQVAPGVTRALIEVRSITLPTWLENLMPVGDKLLPSLLQHFRDEDLEEDWQRQNLVDAYVQFATNDLARLIEALAYATADQFSILADAIVRQQDRATVLAKAEFTKLCHTTEETRPVEPPPLGKALQQWLSDCRGEHTNKGAIALAIPLDDLDDGLHEMFAAGYRPNSIRPYSHQDKMYATVCWNRSRRGWTWRSGLTPAELLELHDTLKSQALQLWDIADYLVDGELRFTALWLNSKGDALPDTRLTLEQNSVDKLATVLGYRNEGYSLHRYLVRVDERGYPRYSMLWAPAVTSSEADNFYDEYLGRNDLSAVAKIMTDCRILMNDPYKTDLVGRYEKAHQGVRLQPNMDPVEKLRIVAAAKIQVDQAESALQSLDIAIGNSPEAVELIYLRGGALAALKDTEGLRQTAQLIALAGRKLYHSHYFLLRAAFIENRLDDAQDHLREMESCCSDMNTISNWLRFELTISNSLLAQAYQNLDRKRFETYRDRAIELLENGDGFTCVFTAAVSREYDAIRSSPRFQNLIVRYGLDGRVVTTTVATPHMTSYWIPFAPWEQHASQTEKLIQEGWTPHCSTVRYSAQRDQMLAGSIWHRHDSTSDAKLAHTRRLTNLALLLLRMQDKDLLDQVLREEFDSDLTSYVVARMADSRVTAELLADAWNNLGTRIRMRKNLLLALSTYPRDQVPEQQYAALVEQLRALRASEPDASLRSAAIACLVRWGEEPANQLLDVSPVAPPSLAHTGNKTSPNWYVNSIGQSMIVVTPPSKYKIGSLATESERFGNEWLQRRYFDGPYAMSATEVTAKQFRQFMEDPKVVAYYASRAQRPKDRSYPEDAPQGNIFVQDAVRFCQWLSEREGIPKEQWCYPESWNSGNDRIHFDRSNRTGYRLPTEAEWEFACRGGVKRRISRDYGDDLRLLPAFAWFDENSGMRNHPVATRLPNSLGFFDLLGNAAEYCYEPYFERLFPSSKETFAEELFDACYDETLRTVRGGASNQDHRAARSAFRNGVSWIRPNATLGFRVARTMPDSP